MKTYRTGGSIAGMAACVAAQGQTWTPTAAGTYSWNSNWTGPFPNAPGAVADLDIDLGGSQHVWQQFKLGELQERSVLQWAGRAVGRAGTDGAGPAGGGWAAAGAAFAPDAMS